MTSLVATVGQGKGTWALLYQMLKTEHWDKILLISNEFGKNNFEMPENAEMISLDENKTITQNTIELMKKLNGKISYDTIAVNLVSGTGKQHMEILSALMKLGTNFRLITLENDQVVEV